MQMSPDDIQEFKEIYEAEFGEELPDADAERRARQLLTFFQIILRILGGHRSGLSPVIDPSGENRRLGKGDTADSISPITPSIDAIDRS